MAQNSYKNLVDAVLDVINSKSDGSWAERKQMIIDEFNVEGVENELSEFISWFGGEVE